MRLLEVRDLRVDFADLIAVDGVSIELDPGDIYGLIGPNGAGKTTTLRAIAGLQEATQGTIQVAGKRLAADPQAYKRALGFMPDVAPVYDSLTAFEFLDHFARAYGVSDRAARVDECLRMTWLTEKRDALCGELSRGMKQRLTLAKTLVPDPPLLLLDEPASGLDPMGRIELRKLLLSLRDAGKAIVVSSHILSEMAEFCNRAGIMERGRLLRSGSIDELARQDARGQRRRLAWRTPIGAAAGLLSIPEVVNLELGELAATFEFIGSDDDLDGLLARLVQAGVRVTEWRALDTDLESIFLRSGAKAVT